MSVERPTVRERANGFTLTFHEEQITFEAARLLEDRTTVKGEIRVRSERTEKRGHLHRAQFNFTSTRSRSELRGALERATKGLDIDWDAILQWVCEIVLDEHRMGEKEVMLSEQKFAEAAVYHISPLIEDRQSTILYGEGDSGKSWLALTMAYLMCTGNEHLGLRPLNDPEHGGAVLYLDWETDKKTIWRRLTMISKGFGTPIPPLLVYRQMLLPLAQDVERIRELVEEYDARLVILDSGVPACGDALKGAEVAAYFRSLQSLKCSTLTIAHVAKEDRKDRPFGSISWRNLARSLWRATANDDRKGEDDLLVRLSNTKNNNDARQRDLAFRFAFDNRERLVKISRAQSEDVEVHEGTLTNLQKIKVALRPGALPVALLAEKAGVSESIVRTEISRHKGEFSSFEKDGQKLIGRSAGGKA